MKLTEREKQLLKDCIEHNKAIPSHFRNKLFANDKVDYVEATKDYKLVYQGKARKEDIIANTPAAPLQKIRSFNSDNPFEDGWQNMLIFGDNLLALKAIYEDQQGKNVFKTKNKIKLIYIDPPFATKQDFMKDREKAYQDKIIGAKFIEFLRKRLILLREILADDGSIYVHLDYKKGHYIKTILDEIFGEHNFINEIVWQRTRTQHSDASRFGNVHDTLYTYKKSSTCIFNKQLKGHKPEYLKRFDQIDENGKRYRLIPAHAPGQGPARKFGDKLLEPPNGRHWTHSQKNIEQLLEKGIIEFASTGMPNIRQYLDENNFAIVQDWWEDITSVNPVSAEKMNYPTQKPETLLERIVSASSNEGDIVVDVFSGSGTSLALSEKLNRKWIGVDCGKLSIYTTQKRLLNLKKNIGTLNRDERRDYQRVRDFEEHSKNARGLFFIYEKARKGDFVITDAFLKKLAEFIEGNLSGNTREDFSLCCPEDKFKVDKFKVVDNKEGKAGEKMVSVGRVNFLISFIQPKEQKEKEQPLKAKEFSLYHAGIYDQALIHDLEWKAYYQFVAQLFGVRLDEHKIYGFYVDGYIGTYPAFIWPYSLQKEHILDKEYVSGLHKSLGGRAGERLYIIAPVCSMGFMEDEITISKTTYVFLKVPLSVLMALIEKGEPGALRQPVSEANVNEVIDAVGFDFISQPVVKADYKRLRPTDRTLLNQKEQDFVIEIKEFKSNTLASDPDDFENFETLSMVLVDCNYNDDYFNLSRVFWSDTILDEGRTKAVVRIPQGEFTGKKMMIIFMDKYGNELKVVKTTKDFK